MQNMIKTAAAYTWEQMAVKGRGTVLSLRIRNAGDSIRLQKVSCWGKGKLILRMDYYTDGYVKAVQFGGKREEFSRGTKRPADILAEERMSCWKLDGMHQKDGKEKACFPSFLKVQTADYRENTG